MQKTQNQQWPTLTPSSSRMVEKKEKKKEKQTTFVKISCLTIIDLAA